MWKQNKVDLLKSLNRLIQNSRKGLHTNLMDIVEAKAWQKWAMRKWGNETYIGHTSVHILLLRFLQKQAMINDLSIYIYENKIIYKPLQ